MISLYILSLLAVFAIEANGEACACTGPPPYFTKKFLMDRHSPEEAREFVPVKGFKIVDCTLVLDCGFKGEPTDDVQHRMDYYPEKVNGVDYLSTTWNLSDMKCVKGSKWKAMGRDVQYVGCYKAKYLIPME